MTGAVEGDTLTELLGLNKLPSLNLRDGVGLAAGLVAAGLTVASVCAFWRGRLTLDELVGESATSGEAVVSADELVASAVLCWRCFFAGEGDSLGNSAGTAV
jgi:hypothetical protein